MSNLTDFLYPKATEQQAKDGVSNSVLMTPLSTRQSLSAFSQSQILAIQSSTSWSPPSRGFVKITATGGGGAGTLTSGVYRSGGAGATAIKEILMEASDALTIVVGAGGSTGDGGSTVITLNGNALLSAGGGISQSTNTSGSRPPQSVAAGGDINIPGSGGTASNASGLSIGGASYWGSGATRGGYTDNQRSALPTFGAGAAYVVSGDRTGGAGIVVLEFRGVA